MHQININLVISERKGIYVRRRFLMKDTCWGILYSTESERITRIEYIEMNDTFYIKENEDLKEEIPEQAFLLQDYSTFPFLISLSRQSSSDENKVDDGLIGKRIIVMQHKNTRADIRIPVSMEIDLHNPVFSEPKKVTVHNLSASGLLFASKELFEVGMEFSFFLPISENPLLLTAIVKNKIPMNTDSAKDTIGYGCMFLSTDTQIESEIRSYVFQQQLHQRKCNDK